MEATKNDFTFSRRPKLFSEKRYKSWMETVKTDGKSRFLVIFQKKMQIWLWLHVNFGDVLILPALKSLNGSISCWLSRFFRSYTLKIEAKDRSNLPFSNWSPVYREKWWFDAVRFTSFGGGPISWPIKTAAKGNPENPFVVMSLLIFCLLCQHWNICWMTIWTIVILKSYNYISLCFFWGDQKQLGYNWSWIRTISSSDYISWI